MATFFPKDLTLGAAYSNSFYTHHQEIAEKGETPCHSYLVHKTIALLESVPGLRVLVAITELIIAKALMCICCYCYKEEPSEELKEEKKDLASPRRDPPHEGFTPRSEPVTPRSPRDGFPADPNAAQAQSAPLPLGDLPSLNGSQAPSPGGPIGAAVQGVVPSPIAPPRRPPFVSSFSKPMAYSSMHQCYSFGIGSMLDLHDIMQLTSISQSFYLYSARQPALVQIRELAEQRAFMKVGLPDRIKRIYEAMRDHGLVDVIPTADSGIGYLHPSLSAIGCSFAVCQGIGGQRGIILLVGGKGDGAIELPSDEGEVNRSTMWIPKQSIISRIFIMERYTRIGEGGWQIERTLDELSTLEKSFESRNNLFAHPEIEDVIGAILSGTHPSLRCISPRVWEERSYQYSTIRINDDIPQGCSLMVGGNGPTMENWGRLIPMHNRGGVWRCEVPLCKGTEFRLYLKTPAGEIIPEDGPNRTRATLSFEALEKPLTSPQFLYI